MKSKRHLIAAILVLLCLIAPMFIIKNVTTTQKEIEGAATVTVALGTIVRSNGRNILRSTFMSAVRTGLRAVTRRLVRTLLPILFRLFLPIFLTTLKSSTAKDIEHIENNKQSLVFALGLGILTLTASFYGVVLFNPNLDPDNFKAGFSLITIAGLAAASLVIHYVVMFWRGLVNNVKITLETSFDGMVLQAYFTGALSYLPLASDISMEGSKTDRARCAAETLIIMLGTSLFLDAMGHLLVWPILEMWAAQVLLYVFVISFPLSPLEGADVFSYHKGWWFLIFFLVLLTFLLNMPGEFYAIL